MESDHHSFFKDNDIFPAVLGVAHLVLLALHLLLSYKCAMIKAGGGVGSLEAVKYSLREYYGYVRLMFGRGGA